jgi:elongation factor 1-beta
MASFGDLKNDAGVKELDQYLLTRSYISGYQASRDDLVVYAALPKAPDAKSTPHAARWYSHIKALLGASFPGAGEGVTIAGNSQSPATAPTAAAAAAPAADDDDDDSNSDDDDDMDFFGEMTPEEQKAAEEKKEMIEKAKARGREKAKLTKSMIIMDVKPWDDTTDLAAMEAEVRAIHKDGLLWGTSRLMPVGFGIKKLQITAVIEDAKVESMDAIIEEELVRDGESDNIQSIDVVAFNKL